MKVVAKPIAMVCWFEKTGVPHPVRFKVAEDDESEKVIKIDKVITVDKEKLAGNPMLVFTCESEINGHLKPYEIKYEINTMKWILFKI